MDILLQAGTVVDTSQAPMWFVATVTGIFFIMFIPWASWATVTIFNLKSSIDLVKQSNEEMKDDMKQMNRKLDSLIMKEVQFLKQILKKTGDDFEENGE
jgi:hypothetical protein